MMMHDKGKKPKKKTQKKAVSSPDAAEHPSKDDAGSKESSFEQDQYHHEDGLESVHQEGEDCSAVDHSKENGFAPQLSSPDHHQDEHDTSVKNAGLDTPPPEQQEPNFDDADTSKQASQALNDPPISANGPIDDNQPSALDHGGVQVAASDADVPLVQEPAQEAAAEAEVQSNQAESGNLDSECSHPSEGSEMSSGVQMYVDTGSREESYHAPDPPNAQNESVGDASCLFSPTDNDDFFGIGSTAGIASVTHQQEPIPAEHAFEAEEPNEHDSQVNFSVDPVDVHGMGSQQVHAGPTSVPEDRSWNAVPMDDASKLFGDAQGYSDDFFGGNYRGVADPAGQASAQYSMQYAPAPAVPTEQMPAADTSAQQDPFGQGGGAAVTRVANDVSDLFGPVSNDVPDLFGPPAQTQEYSFFDNLATQYQQDLQPQPQPQPVAVASAHFATPSNAAYQDANAFYSQQYQEPSQYQEYPQQVQPQYPAQDYQHAAHYQNTQYQGTYDPSQAYYSHQGGQNVGDGYSFHGPGESVTSESSRYLPDAASNLQTSMHTAICNAEQYPQGASTLHQMQTASQPLAQESHYSTATFGSQGTVGDVSSQHPQSVPGQAYNPEPVQTPFGYDASAYSAYTSQTSLQAAQGGHVSREPSQPQQQQPDAFASWQQANETAANNEEPGIEATQLVEDLPFPWQAHLDPGTGCIYYFNTQTGFSSWEPPTQHEIEEQRKLQQQMQFSTYEQQETHDLNSVADNTASHYQHPQASSYDHYPQTDGIVQGAMNTAAAMGSAHYDAPKAEAMHAYSHYSAQAAAAASSHASTERSSSRPSFPAISFGFGGRLAVVFPRVKRNLSVFSGRSEELDQKEIVKPSPVNMYKVEKLSSMLPLYRELQSFPGPLQPSKDTRSKVKTFLAEKLAGPPIGENDWSVNPGTMKLLWILLETLVDCNGELSAVGETSKVTGLEHLVQCLRDPGMVGDQFTNAGGQGQFGGGAGADLMINRAAGNEAATQSALNEMQELLLQGKREEACQKAVENELWAPALLLSSYMNIETYTRVMGEFAKSSFRVGSPLGTLYMLFAGQGTHLFDQDSVEYLTDSWQSNLCVILNNRTPNDNSTILGIGDALWQLRSDAEAAHLCYVLSGHEIEHIDSQTCRIALLGADHRAHPHNFWSPAAIQRTELLEYSKRMKNHKALLAALLPYKLAHAQLLVELGHQQKAMRYLEHILEAARGCKAGTISQRMQYEAEMLELRLRTHMGGKASSSSSLSGSLLGGLRKVLDSAVTSAIYGSQPTGGHMPQPPSQAPSEKQRAAAAQVEKERVAREQRNAAVAAEEKAKEQSRPKRDSVPDGKAPKKHEEEGGEKKAGGLLSKLWGAVAGEKQVDLGDDNSFYFNEKLGRWVERGKENEVANDPSNAPPPTMAAFMQPAGQPGGAPTSMPTMNGQGQAPMMPAAAGMGMGPGAAGGNMFARQTRSGARSRYVDTLNPNAAASQSPTGNMMAAGAPGNMIAANKDAAKPKYKIFVPNQNASNAPDQ